MVYIGYSSDIEKRWELFRKANADPTDKDYNNKIHVAMREFGWDGFTHEILERFWSREDAIEAEAIYIIKYDATNPLFGYNTQKKSKIPKSVKHSPSRFDFIVKV